MKASERIATVGVVAMGVERLTVTVTVTMPAKPPTVTVTVKVVTETLHAILQQRVGLLDSQTHALLSCTSRQCNQHPWLKGLQS